MNQLFVWKKFIYTSNLQGLNETRNQIAFDIHRKTHHIHICQWSDLTNNISINQHKDSIVIIKILINMIKWQLH